MNPGTVRSSLNPGTKRMSMMIGDFTTNKENSSLEGNNHILDQHTVRDGNFKSAGAKDWTSKRRSQ